MLRRIFTILKDEQCYETRDRFQTVWADLKPGDDDSIKLSYTPSIWLVEYGT